MLLNTLAVALATASLHAAEPPPTCIAIVLPSVKGVEGNATEVANAVRDLFASYLNGPAIRTIALDARLASQAATEAAQKDCPQMLTVSLVRSHSGGVLGKAFGQGASVAGWYVPGGASVGAAVARGAAAGGAQAVGTIVASTSAKDEMRLEYTIAPVDAAGRGSTHTEKAKAKADREDLLTPLVEHAAGAILAAVTGQ